MAKFFFTRCDRSSLGEKKGFFAIVIHHHPKHCNCLKTEKRLLGVNVKVFADEQYADLLTGNLWSFQSADNNVCILGETSDSLSSRYIHMQC